MKPFNYSLLTLLSSFLYLSVVACASGLGLDIGDRSEETQSSSYVDWREISDEGRRAQVNENFAQAEELLRKASAAADVDFVWTRLGVIYAEEGKYDKAEEADQRALKVVMERNRDDFTADHLIYLGDHYLDHGKMDEALVCYQKADACMLRFRNESIQVGVMPPPLSGRYAKLHIAKGEYAEAIGLLTERYRLQANGGASPIDLGVLADWLSTAYYCSGDLDRAARMLGGFDLEQRPSAFSFGPTATNNAILLGNIQDRRGNQDMALRYFQSTLKIDPHFPKTGRVNRANMQKQIGKFHMKHGRAAEAESAYRASLALRLETQTEGSPDCADAVKGMADVSVAEDHLTSATVYAERAVRIMDASLVPTHPRVAPSLIALASIEELNGNSGGAALLYARIETICQKPLGPWKEDFMDTAAFYSAGLRSRGKIAEAERLDRIREQQEAKH